MKKKISILLILTTLATISLYVINKLISYFATLENHLTNTRGKYYEWRFGNIYYEKFGSGKPILLIHDMTVHSSSYEWKNIINKLSKTNEVYAIDLLGCGRSDKPIITYTNFLYVQMIEDFIKHIIKKNCDIVATGTSTSFVIMACANDSEMIDQLVLINPLSLKEMAKIPTKRTKTLRFILNIPIIGTTIYNILVRNKTVEKLFKNKYYFNPTKINEIDVKTYYESIYKYKSTKYLFSCIISRYINVNLIHGLSTINKNIFIIVGECNSENRIFAEQYKDLVPSIEIIGIDKTKHLPHMEDADSFLQHIYFIFESEETLS